MWELDHKKGWAPKNWCFWSVALEKTLESPLDSKEIKTVNLKEINCEYSLEGLMLKLKLQYFGHLLWRASLHEKTLMLGKTDDRRRRGDGGCDCQTTSLTQSSWVWENSRRWWRTGKPGMLQSMGSQRIGHDWVNNNTTVNVPDLEH